MSKAGLEVYDDNGDRMLIISKSHMALIFEEWKRRYEEAPETFLPVADDNYGVDCAAYVFDLAKEMGYVSY